MSSNKFNILEINSNEHIGAMMLLHQSNSEIHNMTEVNIKTVQKYIGSGKFILKSVAKRKLMKK